MTHRTLFRWTAWVVLVLILPAVLVVAFFDLNWLRGPIERMTKDKTGRVLAINGDLTVKFVWPLPRIRANAVSFANPPWTAESQMVTADAVEITIDLPQLLAKAIVFPEVRLERPVVFLEQGADGKKNWLLDLNQQDEGMQIRIDRLTLDRGSLGYDDAASKTRIRSQIATSDTLPDGSAGSAVVFSATGQYKGLPLQAHGIGGPVLAVRDEATPYPMDVVVNIGHTKVKANGTITSLLKLSAMDMRLVLSGDSIEQLYPLLGIAAPETRAYVTAGHLIHEKRIWRYENFTGRIGDSTIAGTLQVDSGGKRPVLTADLVSTLLDFSDLGPLIGSRPTRANHSGNAAKSTALTTVPARVLPDLPFKTERWNSVDAEVTLKAETIRRAKELPLENLVAHASLRNSILTLDPLDFGFAGGHLAAAVTLDGSQQPIQARARVRARAIQLARLFPTTALNKASQGQINGEFDLTGKGNSVARMLATSNGKLGLVISGGQVSKLMMEKAGLHLWEMLELKMTGDRLVRMRCAVADFAVRDGTMRTNVLIFDTEVTTITGNGSIDLGQEQLDLTFNQKTKNTSPLALRSPIHVRGSFARPDVGVDKRRVAARALGAIALGLVNPALLLLPLIDAGPGKDSDCGRLMREEKASQAANHRKQRSRDAAATASRDLAAQAPVR